MGLLLKTEGCLGFKEIQLGEWNEAQKDHILKCPRCQAMVRTMVLEEELYISDSKKPRGQWMTTAPGLAAAVVGLGAGAAVYLLFRGSRST